MKRILIIDDDEEMCAELGQMFLREGFEVETACDGKSGLRLIESDRHHVVILDLKLPGFNGFEVLRIVRQKGRLLKVVVLSGRPMDTPLTDGVLPTRQEEEQALLLADAVMNKPFRVHELLTKVRELTVM